MFIVVGVLGHARLCAAAARCSRVSPARKAQRRGSPRSADPTGRRPTRRGLQGVFSPLAARKPHLAVPSHLPPLPFRGLAHSRLAGSHKHESGEKAGPPAPPDPKGALGTGLSSSSSGRSFRKTFYCLCISCLVLLCIVGLLLYYCVCVICLLLCLCYWHEFTSYVMICLICLIWLIWLIVVCELQEDLRGAAAFRARIRDFFGQECTRAYDDRA